MPEVMRRSVFDFTGGPIELFSFLREQQHAGATVVFENEGIVVPPGGASPTENLFLALYASVAENPKIVEDYTRYLVSRMKEAE